MVLEKLKRLIAEKFSVDEEDVTADTTFEELGADSLDLVELIMIAEEEFEVEIADEDVESLTTVGDVVEYINDRV